MKTINCAQITEVVKKLCIDSNYFLGEDVLNAFENFKVHEKSLIGRDVFDNLLLNAKISKEENIPMCQDTGMAVVFVEIGQEVTVEGGNLTDAINLGVAKGYEEGFLRKSIVKDPLERENTGNNTPAIIHYDILPGNELKITVAPKGFGSENMSALKMLKPSDGIKGVKQFIIDTVKNAGPNPCPPIVVGVGLGGTMERAAFLSKKSLLRPVGQNSEKKHLEELEKELLDKINALGIGPAGLGGSITALAVNIEAYPTHIAGLPVAVNLCCHALRHAEHTF